MRHEASLNLAAIGNCEVAALLDPRGAISWTCWPLPDADPVVGSLLDARGSEARRRFEVPDGAPAHDGQVLRA